MLYITYKKFGVLQRATVNKDRYNQLQNDSSIENLQIHSSQFEMDNFYKECKGLPKNNKQILLG